MRYAQVEWDRRPDFASGQDGGPEGKQAVDSTTSLCGTCVASFSLGNLTLTINGTNNFFGRLNAGNRILVRMKKCASYNSGCDKVGMFSLVSLPRPCDLLVVIGHSA